ncbi:small ribosomal subunit protein eS8-like [Symsagittifera roscoffensis]|uniref:small ribosomal subunit protein eS8-like n=1 Tax=Symsagittifera roscoffensis TaxID=84072 RepID=UPI00307CC478
MGISQAKFSKRKKTGGRFNKWRKKRKFELGRPAAMTKLMPERIRPMRVRGGNIKMRALRIDTGNFSWPSEHCTRKAKILDVLYNATNNEMVRTKTIVKNCIVKIDASAFKSWYQEKYAVGSAQGKEFAELAELSENVYVKPPKTAEEKAAAVKKKKDAKARKADLKKVDSKKGGKVSKAKEEVVKKKPKKVVNVILIPKIDAVLKDAMKQGYAYACVSSRPGQCGRADGYILEGKELDFYRKKMDKKKQK